MGRNKGILNGRTYYGNVCEDHHRKVKNEIGRHIAERIPNKKCEQCGWDKSYCDRHRIKPELGYVNGNVKILCPNCHRVATSSIAK
jgi:hypothetical protein